MRGTVLRLKSHSFDLNSDNDNSGDDSKCEDQTSVPHNGSAMALETPTQDENKNLLMSHLELQSSSSDIKKDQHFTNHEEPPFHRPVFDWNDGLMWKAMSRHPLFSKYMELQSQLNSLFEEIRLDCKKAACAKAFASLVKDTADSPIVRQQYNISDVSMPSRFQAEEPPKKRGRPIKKKAGPGRPKKDTSTLVDNDVAATPIKTLRKCKDELFLSRKPSWICQNCAKCFSSSGWLDRHKSVCSFSKLPSTDSIDENQILSQSSTPQNGSVASASLKSKIVDERVSSNPVPFESSDTLSPSRTSVIMHPKEMLANQSPNSSISPLQPKKENHNNADDEEDPKPKKQLFDDETRRSEVGSAVFSCGKCKQQFTVQALLKRHWEEFSDCKLFASHHGSDGESGEYSSDSSSSACKHCGKSFQNNKFLKRHQSMCHMRAKKKIWQCVHCLKSFSRPKRHEQHQKKCSDSKEKHKGRETLRCENCSLTFPTQKKLLKHQAICCPDSTNHMIKLLKCVSCSMVFPTYKKQLKHRAVCCPDSETDEMVCSLCFKVLIMPDRMAAHRKKCGKTQKKL